MMEKRCPDIELIEIVTAEHFNKEPRAVAPNLVRIDGQEMLVEAGSIKIRGGNDDECVRVSLTLYAGSLLVSQELRNTAIPFDD